MIDQLQILMPDPARSQRVIAKCHKKMARRPKRRVAERAILAGFCVFYLSSIVLTAIDVFLAG